MQADTRISISIIMPCFQQVSFVETAVRSVLDQADDSVELIVMDPGSSDGTREKLRGLTAEYGDNLILVLEADEGQSDAINKGMSLARGEVLAWLNSDDCFRPGTLKKVSDALLGKSGPAWLYGTAGNIDENGQPVYTLITWYKRVRSKRFTRLKLLRENFIPQMSTFWNRKMWDVAGGVDVNKHLDMDYDLWLRFSRHADPIVIDEELADFRIHSEAKGSTTYVDQLNAAYMTAREYAPELGFRGKIALIVHWFLSMRTRLVYYFIKP
jgi:glycosyltransferase involved in cell wall biosynthesis